MSLLRSALPRWLLAAALIGAVLAGTQAAQAQPPLPRDWRGPHYFWHGRYYHHRDWAYDHNHHRYQRYH